MLNQIRLKNFKRFKDVSLRVGNLTVLMGVNGAGKSTLIQSLLVTRQSLDSGALSRNAIALSGELAQIGTGQDLLFEGAGGEENITIAFDFDGTTTEIVAHYDAQSDELAVSNPVTRNELVGLGMDTFTYLGAERLGPRLSAPLSGARAVAGRLGPQGEGTLAVLQYHGSKLLTAGDPRILEGVPRSIEEQTQAYLALVSPGARLSVSRNDRLDSVSAAYEFSGEGGVGTRPFRPTNVGFGLSYSLPIIVGCLTAVPGALLIVENPEAHLHTTGQRKLARLLAATASAGVQVIIETHSRELFYEFRELSRNTDSIKNSILHYFSSSPQGNISKLDINTLDPIGRDLNDWPEEFFNAFGRPTDLIPGAR